MKAKTVVIAGLITAGLIGLVVLCSAMMLAGGDPEFVDPTTNVQLQDRPGSEEVVPPSKQNKAVIGEGMWLVGTDVDAGTYKTAGARDGLVVFCVWSVKLTDKDNAEIVVFGSSDKTNEPGRVTLKKGQLLETSGCADWVKQ